MKLADSLNPATQAENIKKLNAGLESVDAKTLPGTSTATTGQILKLTGENKTPSWAEEYRYTPPAYSETEVNTGQKWIDGKDIYSCVYSGDIEAQTSSFSLVYFSDLSITPIYTLGTISNSDNTLFIFISRLDTAYNSTNGRLYSASIPVTYSEGHYNLIIYYTKPDPAPETRDDDTPEEVKETKTRKKTIK